MKKMMRLLVFLWIGLFLTGCGSRPLLEEVTVQPGEITPDADGITDLAAMQFRLNRSANVAIYLYDSAGQRYTFRPLTYLGANEDMYKVLFPGIVDPFSLPTDNFDGFQVLKRMLPDGIYTWEITARSQDEKESSSITGTLKISNADTSLPEIRGFSVFPKEFSPNQDGIDDRVTINLDLKKDVDELTVYLLNNEGIRNHIAENEQTTPLNQQGWHTFDYDGGIDSGAEPPENGIYTVYAEARDKMGQRVVATDTVSIINAGMPSAYIYNGTVEYSSSTLVLSDTLCFTMTIENDSRTPIRTTGPWPGTTYRTDQNFNTLGYSEESGVFRVGLNYDTSLRDYPFRWGIGKPDIDLVKIGESWYLPPHARSLVTGCVQIVDMPPRNPLYYWAGLIHEDVEIASVNNRVDPEYIKIWEP